MLSTKRQRASCPPGRCGFGPHKKCERFGYCIVVNGRAPESDEEDEEEREADYNDGKRGDGSHQPPAVTPAPVAAPSALAMPLPTFSLVHDEHGRSGLHPVQAAKAQIVRSMLSRTFPLRHRDRAHEEVAEKLRRCEKYETTLQGDDYTDKDDKHTNTEALSYAKAAAAVMSITEFQLSELCRGSKEHAVARLTQVPFIGASSASKVYDLVRTGTCQQLHAFETNAYPKGSDGQTRARTPSGRSMAGAHAKRLLSKVLGISAIRAGDMYDGMLPGLPPIRSVEELRALPMPQHKALRSSSAGRRQLSAANLAPSMPLVPSKPDDDDDDEEELDEHHDPSGMPGGRASFTFGLTNHESLQEPIPPEEAERMRTVCLETVRRQQGCRGCQCECTRPFDGGGGGGGASLVGAACCDCCWHVSFVGGAPRRGYAGHDVDLLVWHRRKEASWGDGAEGCVLGTLKAELEAREARGEGGLVPRKTGWQMPKLCHAKRQMLGGARAHRRSVDACTGTSHGFENLSQDAHDKVFGVWRTPQGRCHRIDIVVNSFPEELALCRLTWIGSRLLNRLLRQHALNNGLTLTAHALLVTQQDKPLFLRDHATGEVTRIPALGQAVPVEVPYRFLQSERDLLFLLGGCTDAFLGLVDPRNRNA